MVKSPEEMRKRHNFIMEQHTIHMRRSRWFAGILVAFLVFVIVMSLLILFNSELAGVEGEMIGSHLKSAIAIYTTAILILLAEILMLIKSRYRAIELSIKMTNLSFEMGRLIGQNSVDRND